MPCYRRSNRPSLTISQIVLNPPTYPNFLWFLDLRKRARARAVEVIETEMTFGVSRDSGAFEWAGDGLRSLFCQPQSVFDLGMWRMLFDILRFYACAVRVLTEDDDDPVHRGVLAEGGVFVAV